MNTVQRLLSYVKDDAKEYFLLTLLDERKTLLSDHIQAELHSIDPTKHKAPQRPIMKVLKDSVHGCLELTIEQLRADTRKPNIIFGRQLFMSALYTSTPESLVSVGDVFGKDHATVLHSMKALTSAYSTDKQKREVINCVAKTLADEGFDGFQKWCSKIKILQHEKYVSE